MYILEDAFKKVEKFPKYKLVDGGERIMIEFTEGKFKSLGLHHISENGVLCDDMETFIEWEKFSK